MGEKGEDQNGAKPKWLGEDQVRLGKNRGEGGMERWRQRSGGRAEGGRDGGGEEWEDRNDAKVKRL